MLSQSFNRKRLIISALLLIPIILGCLLVFNQGIIAQPSSQAYETNTDPIIYARSIEIKILADGKLEVDEINTSRKNLHKTLASLHTDLTKEQRNDVINIHVTSQKDITYQDLVFIQNVATRYGYFRIVTPHEEIVRSKGNTPMIQRTFLNQKAKYQQTSQDYATEFVKGAERNGKKAFVIEIKNRSVTINGKASSVKTLRKDIDAITKDWEETDYTAAYPSILIKNPDKDFLKKLNAEFLKTNYSKANGGMDLIPPPPPPAPKALSQLPPPPPPTVVDHLKSMNDIDGVFYYENKEISFEKAVRLVKANKDLNVQTRHPYTHAPKTYISKQPIVFETDTQNKKSVTKEDIKVYNKLAKKYHTNPNGQILRSEIAFMYDIYTRMTNEQKKNAESYPALPPPPAPVKPAKKESRSEKATPAKKTKKGNGYVNIDGETYYYASIDGEKNYFDRWGNKVELTETQKKKIGKGTTLPPPTPLPASTPKSKSSKNAQSHFPF